MAVSMPFCILLGNGNELNRRENTWRRTKSGKMYLTKYVGQQNSAADSWRGAISLREREREKKKKMKMMMMMMKKKKKILDLFSKLFFPHSPTRSLSFSFLFFSSHGSYCCPSTISISISISIDRSNRRTEQKV